MKRSRTNLALAFAVKCSLALAGATLFHSGAYAQSAADNHSYCAIYGMGATVCYFDNLAACARAAGDGCIQNPGFTGGNATARASVQPSHKPRRDSK